MTFPVFQVDAFTERPFSGSCRVNSEAELTEIYNKALQSGLEVHLITDSGKTEFHGQPTQTSLAIGPDDADKIDVITGHLELL